MTEPTARVIYAGLHLLDRQLIDREGRLAGNVDDVELERLEDGRLVVTAVLSGGGALARRFRLRAFAAWRERHLRDEAVSRIPVDRVTELGPAVRIALDHEELATFMTERWVRDHVTSHIPGHDHASG